ncbi:MAG: hypothetical protein WD671_05600, partial [Parvibaculum sp.]
RIPDVKIDARKRQWNQRVGQSKRRTRRICAQQRGGARSRRRSSGEIEHGDCIAKLGQENLYIPIP